MTRPPDEEINDRGCWPTASQERLLQAALWQGADARRAWEDWQARVDIMDLDLGSTRLLPLLYHNLKRQGVNDPRMARFQGVYRQSWYKNQLLAGRVTPLLQALRDAGVRTLLLKGAVLIQDYYADWGLRPMSDFDILVPVSQALRAGEVLTALGWTLGPTELKPPTASVLAMKKSQEYRCPSGERVDLHWHVHPQCLQADADDEFWRDSRPACFRGVETAVPSPTDMFLHVCVHGTQGGLGMPPMRWVADAVIVMERAEAEIDWEALQERARARRLSLPLRDTLTYLADTMRVPVPPGTLAALAAMPTTRAERRAYAAWSAPTMRHSPLLTLLLRYDAYRQWAREDGQQEQGQTPLHYLQCWWQLDHLRQVPFAALLRVWRRIRNQFRLRPSRT